MRDWRMVLVVCVIVVDALFGLVIATQHGEWSVARWTYQTLWKWAPPIEGVTPPDRFK